MSVLLEELTLWVSSKLCQYSTILSTIQSLLTILTGVYFPPPLVTEFPAGFTCFCRTQECINMLVGALLTIQITEQIHIVCESLPNQLFNWLQVRGDLKCHWTISSCHSSRHGTRQKRISNQFHNKMSVTYHTSRTGLNGKITQTVFCVVVEESYSSSVKVATRCCPPANVTLRLKLLTIPPSLWVQILLLSLLWRVLQLQPVIEACLLTCIKHLFVVFFLPLDFSFFLHFAVPESISKSC